MNAPPGDRVSASTAGSEADLVSTPHLTISFIEFVCLIAALMALTALSIDIMLPALPQIGASLGVSDENERQLIIIMYMAGFAVGQLFYGALSDRLGRKPVLLAGLGIFLVGTLGALWASTFHVLLFARFVQGLGAASPRVVAIAVVRDLFNGRQMARVMSFAMMIFILIPVFAPSVGQALIHLGNWHWMFGVLFAMGLMVALWSMLRLSETSEVVLAHRRALSLTASLNAVLTTPRTMAYGIAGGLMFGCLLAYIASSQQVFVGLYGLGQAFPVIFGAIASVMVFASFTNAQLVGRLGMRRLSHSALAGFIAVSAILVLIAAVTQHVPLWVFGFLLATMFFLFGLIAPNFNAIAMEPQGHNAGMASSVVGALSTAIGAACGGLIGSAFNGTVLPLGLGFFGCALLSALIIVAVEGRSGLFGRNTATAAGR